MYVIITGASSGIGKVTALRLSKQPGYHVFAGVRSESALEASPGLTPVLLDVTIPKTIQKTVRMVSKQIAGAREIALINNAGVIFYGPLEFVPLATFREQFEVNLFGMLAVTQAFLPLIRQQGGRIINIGSMHGRLAAATVGPYSAAKFALRSVTDTLRLELSPWKISVSLIEAGVVSTRMMQNAAQDLRSALPDGPPKELYGHSYATMENLAKKLVPMTSKPEAVARIIMQSLSARRPKPYYRIGVDAWGIALMSSLIPISLRDLILRWLYGLNNSSTKQGQAMF